jgi:hypothetical protein
LGERLLCKQEVVGSIPSSSTSQRSAGTIDCRAQRSSVAMRGFPAWAGLKAVALFNNLEGKKVRDLMRVLYPGLSCICPGTGNKRLVRGYKRKHIP